MLRNNSPLADPAEIWDRLSPEAKRELGIVAVIIGLGAAGDQNSPGAPAALYAGLTAIENLAAEHLLQNDMLPRPDLAAIGVLACRSCGCTDECGCRGGCWWAEPGLCSQCANRGEVGMRSAQAA